MQTSFSVGTLLNFNPLMCIKAVWQVVEFLKAGYFSRVLSTRQNALHSQQLKSTLTHSDSGYITL